MLSTFRGSLIVYLLSISLSVSILLSNFLFLTFSQNYKTVDNQRTKEILIYFRGKNKLDVNLYSNQAIIHLADVKKLINFAFIVNIIAITLILFFLIYLFKKKKTQIIRRSAFLASILTVALIILVLIASLLSFDFFFVQFHKIFFRNDLWQFPADDNLIKLFPPVFFISFTKQLVFNILMSAILLISAVFCLKRNDSKTN